MSLGQPFYIFELVPEETCLSGPKERFAKPYSLQFKSGRLLHFYFSPHTLRQTFDSQSVTYKYTLPHTHSVFLVYEARNRNGAYRTQIGTGGVASSLLRRKKAQLFYVFEKCKKVSLEILSSPQWTSYAHLSNPELKYKNFNLSGPLDRVEKLLCADICIV